jgi:hypothetical protein
MNYEIILTNQTIAETGVLTLSLNQQIEISISGEAARRQVSRWAHLNLSSQIRAMEPQLMVQGGDGRAVWRVPLHLTLPAWGDVGSVGVLAVDVQTGEMAVTEWQVEEFRAHADALAHRFTSVPA